MMTEAL